MINIDYQITFQDDLDANETDIEYMLNLSWFKWLFRGSSLGGILSGLGLIVLTTEESHNSNGDLWTVGLGAFFIILGLSLPWLIKPSLAQSFFNRRDMKKRWNRKTSSEEFRNLTLTEKELILKTQFSETAYKRNCCKVFFEGKKGILVRFCSGQNRYIPKKIFSDPQTIEKIKIFCTMSN